VGYSRAQGVGRDSSHARVVRILWVILLLNVVVALAKLSYGLFASSISMTADGFHSLFDGASNVVGLVGLYAASRPADSDHPYGHSKYETWASVAIGVMLLLAAWVVGNEALTRLLDGGAGPEIGPGAFVVMVGTLCINVGVATYERRAARKLGSEILSADAAHTSSDVFVSLGVIGGLVAVMLGAPLADPIIAVFVVGMILRAAWLVLRRAEATLSDKSRIPPGLIAEVSERVEGVLGCHEIRTRGPANAVFVDLHIQVDPDLGIASAHAIAEDVERTIAGEFLQVADVIVHVEPLDAYEQAKTLDPSRLHDG